MLRSSAGSFLGGYKWEPNGNGGWTLNCNEGESKATQLDPLDKYRMGLIPAKNVPTLYTYPASDPSPILLCSKTISNVASQVTIAQIIANYGQRTPGPANAKRDFSIGFVAESHQRLLTPTELTFNVGKALLAVSRNAADNGLFVPSELTPVEALRACQFAGSLTVMLLATSLTPATFLARSAALDFCSRAVTKPLNWTVPFHVSTLTPLNLYSGSADSASSTREVVARSSTR